MFNTSALGVLTQFAQTLGKSVAQLKKWVYLASANERKTLIKT